MALLKRESKDLQALRDITDDVDEAAFCPYACHIDPHTILTKNGELMQTLKIVGFTYEDITKKSENLRNTIRRALNDSLQTTDYALWLHTIRRKASLRPKGEYPNDFSRIMNNMWNELKDWEHQYVNEVYITIVKEGESAKMKQPTHFFRSMIPALERKKRWKYLDSAVDDLTQTVDRLHDRLSDFGAKKLGLFEKNNVVYSEPLTFISKLITLKDHPLPLPDIGLDDFLTAQEITFGFNALEVREANARRRFGAILALKEYREMPTESIDLLLQTSAEFIITQSMDFINAKKALGEYKKQNQIFELSGETELPNLIGLDEILDSDQSRASDFGEQQISVFVLGDSVRNMEDNIQITVHALSGIGIISMREDIKLEEAYWAQLPANFEFLRRLRSVAANKVAGFANISNYPAGLASGSIWGSPVTTFHTAANTPYFFNFHVANNGHTSIIGPYGFGKTVLLNFLVSEAQKFNPKLFFFDNNRGSEIFLRSINANYNFILRKPVHESINSERPSFHKMPLMNPLSLVDTVENRSFLVLWLDALLRADKFYRPENSDEFWPEFEKGLDFIFSQPKEQRHLTTLIEHYKETAPKLATKLYGWYKTGEFSRWFDHEEDTLDISSSRKVAFEMAEILKTPNIAPPIIAYLLHRVMEMLDGEPAIIVLDEAWEMLDNPIMASRLGGWLEQLRSKNAIVILSSERAEEVLKSSINADIMEHVATQIYLPNPAVNSNDYERTFGLTSMEAQTLSKMNVRQRQFLLKRGLQSIVAQLDLGQLKQQVALLSAKEPALNLMTKLISETSLNPKDWVIQFFEGVEKA